MLDGGSFMRAGWVHDIKLHPFTVSGDHGANRFIIMGKVRIFICFESSVTMIFR